MAAALDFGRFEVLSFDCFGTLIDFERGVLTALRPILDRHGVALSDDELLETYGALKLPVGLTSVWINRRHDRPGFGGTPPGQAEPDLRVPDLRTLADLVEEQRGATADR